MSAQRCSDCGAVLNRLAATCCDAQFGRYLVASAMVTQAEMNLAVDAAVLAEREACAKVAEGMAIERSDRAAELRAKGATIAADYHADAVFEIRKVGVAIRARSGHPAAEEEGRIYPCADCGVMRTKDEGALCFTVCDDCWNKAYPPKPDAVALAIEALEFVSAQTAEFSGWDFRDWDIAKTQLIEMGKQCTAALAALRWVAK